MDFKGLSVKSLFERLHLNMPLRLNNNEARAESYLNAVSLRIYTIGKAGGYHKNMTAEDLGSGVLSQFNEGGRYLFVQLDPKKVAI